MCVLMGCDAIRYVDQTQKKTRKCFFQGIVYLLHIIRLKVKHVKYIQVNIPISLLPFTFISQQLLKNLGGKALVWLINPRKSIFVFFRYKRNTLSRRKVRRSREGSSNFVFLHCRKITVLKKSKVQLLFLVCLFV